MCSATLAYSENWPPSPILQWARSSSPQPYSGDRRAATAASSSVGSSAAAKAVRASRTGWVAYTSEEVSTR